MTEGRCRLELIGITYNQIESGVYALILQECGTSRRLPIIIGFPEAQAIECKLQEVATPRPMTHDTMAAALSSFGISLTEVVIRRLPNGVFAADLHFTDGNNERVVDARSSDAVALAIRVGAPIFTSEEVMRKAAFDRKSAENRAAENNGNEDVLSVSTSERPLESMTLSQLQEIMLQASDREDYGEAARIKAEIDRRKQNKDQ